MGGVAFTFLVASFCIGTAACESAAKFSANLAVKTATTLCAPVVYDGDTNHFFVPAIAFVRFVPKADVSRCSNLTCVDGPNLLDHLVGGHEQARWHANRIGASRLQQMSHILQVPVAFFFEGLPIGGELSMAQIDDFVSDSEGLRLISAFVRIDNAALRRRIVVIVSDKADRYEIAIAHGSPFQG